MKTDIFGALIGRPQMKVKIIVNGMEMVEGTNRFTRHTSEVWSGEMEIKEGVYVTKLSIIAEGEAHPICDVPFSLTEGYWLWHSAEAEWPKDTERIGGNAFNQLGKKIET